MVEFILFFLIGFTIFFVFYDKHDYWHRYKITKEEGRWYPMYQNFFCIWKYYTVIENNVWYTRSFNTEEAAKQWLRQNTLYYE